jgi:hypothetical protein
VLSRLVLAGLIGACLAPATAAAERWQLAEIRVSTPEDGLQIHEIERGIDGGYVELDVSGDRRGQCATGSERVRFQWSFDSPVATLEAGDELRVHLNVSQVAATPPCNDSITRRSSLSVGGSDGWQSPALPDELEAQIDRGMVTPATAKRVFGLDTRPAETRTGTLHIGPRAAAPGQPLAYFYLTADSAGANVEIVYVYDSRLSEPRVIPAVE